VNPLLIAIDAKFIHTNNAVRLLKANSAFDVDIAEFTIKDSIDSMLDTIKAKKPLFVGISTYIWNVEIVRNLIKKVKEECELPIVLGGPEVSYDPHHFLNAANADVVVKGEGEHVFDDVVRHFKNGQSLGNTPNIAMVTPERIDTPIQEIDDLSGLKLPHFFEEDREHIPHKIQYLESSRGCPYRCSYCLSSLEKTLRFFDIESLKKAISHLSNLGAKTFKFLDRTFNVSKHALPIIEFIIETHRLGSVFQFEMTGDTLNEEIVDYIHTHAPKNLFRFEIGIQSTNDITNRLVDRKQDNEKLFRVIRKIQKESVIDLHLDLIAGLPKEDLQRFSKTFNEVYALGAKELQLGFLKFLRGTKIRKEASRFHYRFQERAPYEILKSEDLSPADLQRMKNVEAALDLFHNKGYFRETLYQIFSAHYENFFELFERLYQRYTASNLPIKGYQLHTLYAFIETFLKEDGVTQDCLDALKHTYLSVHKVKPKCYFTKIEDKKLKHKLFETLQEKTGIPVHDFFKHAVATKYKSGYLIALYKNHEVFLYTL